VITETTTGKIAALVGGLLNEHTTELNHAYLAAGDEPLRVSVGLKLEAWGGDIKCEASISFATQKIKDKRTEIVESPQKQLFDKIESIDIKPAPDTAEEGEAA